MSYVLVSVELRAFGPLTPTVQEQHDTSPEGFLTFLSGDPIAFASVAP